MKSRWIINILLFLAIGILSLIGYYKPGIDETPDNLATHLKPKEVTHISIRSIISEGVDLYKEQDEWYIKAAKPIPADTTRVVPLTRLASQIFTRDYPSGQLNLENIGLSPSRGSVTLNDIQVNFGRVDAIESLRYIQTSDRIALITDKYQHMVNADLVYFASPRIVRENQRIQSIQLPGLTVTQTSGKWLTVPDNLAGSDTISQFITGWENASAINIERYEQSIKTEQIILYLRKPDEIVHLDIIDSDNTLVLGRPDIGLQYKLGGRQDELLHLINPDNTNGEKE